MYLKQTNQNKLINKINFIGLLTVSCILTYYNSGKRLSTKTMSYNT